MLSLDPSHWFRMTRRDSLGRFIKGAVLTPNLKGENHFNWKGGFYFHEGYKLIYKPDYFSADKDGYVKEHRYVYETFHKCCIVSWGLVHHVNEDKLDNRIENLKGMTRSQHNTLHNQGNQYGKVDMIGRSCFVCGTTESWRDPSHKYANWYFDKEDKTKLLCRKHYKQKYRYR